MREYMCTHIEHVHLFLKLKPIGNWKGLNKLTLMQSLLNFRCAKDIHGELIGSYNSNPLLNLMLYDMEFPDGQIKQYGANVITENMYSQVNEEGYSTTIIDSINDYQKESNTIAMSQKFAHTTKSGQKQA
jgi:hypothetical protein